MATLLIMVPVPEAEPRVAALRARFDPSAKRGLGAHITLVHSKMSADIGSGTMERIAAAASAVLAFPYQLTRVARFPGTVYLAAEPTAPFVRLAATLSAAMLSDARVPAQAAPLVPHVSVVRKSTADDREVAAELEILLRRDGPIDCLCSRIVLLEDSSGLWQPLRECVLGAASTGSSNGDFPDSGADRN
jgi:2'-5' RNA ligase